MRSGWWLPLAVLAAAAAGLSPPVAARAALPGAPVEVSRPRTHGPIHLDDGVKSPHSPPRAQPAALEAQTPPHAAAAAANSAPKPANGSSVWLPAAAALLASLALLGLCVSCNDSRRRSVVVLDASDDDDSSHSDGSELSIPGTTQLLVNPLSPDALLALMSDTDNRAYAIHAEFEAIPPVQTALPTESGAAKSNSDKNRYLDILPYDSTRVKLKRTMSQRKPRSALLRPTRVESSGHVSFLPSNNSPDGYINANFIDGFSKPNEYIAAQGPLPETVADFWAMVWERGSNTVVMITGLVENGRKKCHRYWPEKGAASVTFGDFEVSVVGDAQHGGDGAFVSRRLMVRHIGAPAGHEQARVVRHLQYLHWPDHGAPSETDGALRLLEQSKQGAVGPIVVHCSAGVGRSGTFIAIDINLQRLRAKGLADVMGTVGYMRRQRMHMVQSISQYMFVYKALADALLYSALVPASRLPAHIAGLGEAAGPDGETRLELERNSLLEYLGQLQPADAVDAQYSSGAVEPKKDSPKGPAAQLHSFGHFSTVRTTKTPLETEFWQQAVLTNPLAVVCISAPGSAPLKTDFALSSVDANGGAFVVELRNTSWTSRFVIQDYDVARPGQSEPTTIKCFFVLNWSDGSTPPPRGIVEMVGMLDAMEDEQQQQQEGEVMVERTGHSHVHPRNTVLVSSPSPKEAAFFGACARSIHQLKAVGMVCVPEAVKSMYTAEERQDSALTEAQFEGCYLVLEEYLHSLGEHPEFTIETDV